MAESAPSMVKQVIAVLTANGYADARDPNAPARERKFTVDGAITAVVTMSWGPDGPEDHKWLDNCADVVRANGFQVEDRQSYFIVRECAG